jgi:hypothetical protein
LTSEKNHLEVLLHETKRKEQLLLAKEKELEKDFMKIQLTKEGLKPINELYRSEKEKLLELKEELKSLEEELSHREAIISRRESDLRKREGEVEKILHIDIAEEKERMRERDRQRAEYHRAIQRNYEILEKEKNKIYKCSLEMKRQYDIIQVGYRKWKQVMRSTKINGGRSVGRYGEGVYREHWSQDDLKITEIDDEINWSDIIGDIREEVHLLEMGPDQEAMEEKRGILVSNQECELEQRVIPRWSSSSSASKVEPSRDHRSAEKVTLTTPRTGDDALSVVDVNYSEKPRERGLDDSLEYSFITTSPNGNREPSKDEIHHYPPNSRAGARREDQTPRLRTRIGVSYPPPVPYLGEVWHSEHSHQRRDEGKQMMDDHNGRSVSATIDLQITTEQMKSIAMKYNAL